MIDKMTFDVLKSSVMMARETAKATPGDGAKLRVSALFPKWRSGAHTEGEIYNAGGQTWECFREYDNAVYPDVNPDNVAWYTFNRPLHGSSPETAREFVTVTGAHDIYRAGEYAIYDGEIYECVQDTSYSPVTYPQAWKKHE